MMDRPADKRKFLLDVVMQRREKLLKRPVGHKLILSGLGELRPEQRAPCFQRVAVAALTGEVDGGGGIAARLHEQIARPLLAGMIHPVADRRSQARRIGPRIEDAVGHRGEKALQFTVELPLPPAIKTFEGHYLD